MKGKEMYTTLKQYEDGLITPIECLYRLFNTLSEEMKVVKEIESFLKDMLNGEYVDDLYTAGKLLYFSKKLDKLNKQ